MRVPVTIDRRAETPLQRQLYDVLRQAILSGRLAPRTRVPSTRELAGSLGVSRMTVTSAYEQLAAEGYIEARHGSGTFVSTQLPDTAIEAPRGRGTKAPGTVAPIRLSRFTEWVGEEPATASATRGTIDLSAFSPDFERFPFALWRRLLGRHVKGAAIFHYADDGSGHRELRAQIGSYVGRSRAVQCEPEQVVVVSGSQQALDLCARILLEPGDRVAVEDPGYQGARFLFAACGAELRPVRVDGEGLVVRELPDDARVIYVTPSHQFPTGASMSLPRRLELLAWARQRNAVVIEDDYDSEYRYHGAPLPAVHSLVAGAPVIYVGTFSKVMFPGLRLGYVVLPRPLVAPFRRAKWLTDRQSSQLEQAALADFLSEGHLERHVRRMRALYARRRVVLVDALQQYFGRHATVLGDEAGMHVMVRFPGPPLGRDLVANGVRIASARKYYAVLPPGNDFVIGFCATSERSIREGVRRLAGAF